MSSRPKIESVYDFTEKGLVELKAWLEPWFLDRGGMVEWEDVGVGCGPVTVTVADLILSHSPWGFWKLDESSGSVAADSSGNGLDLTSDSIPPTWGAPAGPPGDQAADFETGTGGLSGTAGRVARTWAGVTGDFTAGIFVSRNSTDGTPVLGQGNPGRSGGSGWQLSITSAATVPANAVRFVVMNSGTNTVALNADNPLAASTWAMIAAVHDGTGWRLNINGLDQTATSTGAYTPYSSPLWIGHDNGLGGNAVNVPQFVGSYAFLIQEALTAADLLAIYEAGTP